MNTLNINVEPHKLNDFQKAIEKIKKLAIRNGMTPPTYTKGAMEQITRRFYSPSTEGGLTFTECIVDVYPIEINMEETYRMNGYDFVATVRFEDDFVDLRNIEEVLPEHLGVKYHKCDHCNGTHHARNKSFIFKKDNEYKQIGRNCAKEFFGVGGEAILKLNAEMSILVDNYFGDLEFDSSRTFEEDKSWIEARRIVDLNMMFATTYNVLKANNFEYVKKLWETEQVSWGRSETYRINEGKATTELVERAINRKNEHYATEYAELLEAKEFINNEPGETHTADGELTFLGNLKSVCKLETKVRMGDVWKVVWTILKYEQHKRQVARLEEASQTSFIGTVGSKSTIKFTVQEVKTGIGMYGEWKMYIGVDENNNPIKKFGKISSRFAISRPAGEKSSEAVVGDVCLFDAEIKGHEERAGIKTTNLGRVSKPSKIAA